MDKISRNKPCPCGSGKKNKYCCGNREAVGLLHPVAGMLSSVRNEAAGKTVPPAHAEALNEQGTTYAQQSRFIEAKACYEKALAINPHYIGALNNLGLVLKELGQLDGAIACYESALGQLTPVYIRAYNNLGIAFKESGRHQEAIACYKKALEAMPDSPDILSNLGNILSDQKKYNEAIPYFKQVLAIAPDFSTYNILGYCLQKTGNYADAIQNFQQALAIEPEKATVLLNMAACYTGQGRLNEVIDSVLRAIAVDPDNPKTYCGLLMTRHYDMNTTNEELFAQALQFAEKYEAPLQESRCIEVQTWKPGRRLRVGLVSADLYNHPVGYFLEAVLLQFDREALSLVAYTNQAADDDLSERIKPCFDEWINVRNLSDVQLAERISEDGLDLLLDLSGHTLDNRLLAFAHKPAPVQATWLGYANTTGMASMDFILADSTTLPPEEEQFYTEKVWRLPETYVCFTPPDFDLPVSGLPSLSTGHISFGCFNNPAKINGSVVACWSEILRSVPDSVLLLKYKNFEHEAEQELIRQRFHAHGIEPGRLRFAGASTRDAYLAAYREVDICLDPFPFPGLTTTCEALWMGVPTLTLRLARGMYGHNGELVMKSVGLGEWVADSIEEYRELALAFSSKSDRLALLRQSLRQRLLLSPLCAAERFARHLEDAFRGMVLASATTGLR